MKNTKEHPMAEFEEAALALKVLAHPVRLQIIRHLGRYGRLNVNALTAQLPLPQAVVSQHLVKLMDRNILKRSRQGRESYYCLANPQLITMLDVLFQCKSTPVHRQ